MATCSCSYIIFLCCCFFCHGSSISVSSYRTMLDQQQQQQPLKRLEDAKFCSGVLFCCRSVRLTVYPSVLLHPRVMALLVPLLLLLLRLGYNNTVCWTDRHHVLQLEKQLQTLSAQNQCYLCPTSKGDRSCCCCFCFCCCRGGSCPLFVRSFAQCSDVRMPRRALDWTIIEGV